jgi:hypothetical protein
MPTKSVPKFDGSFGLTEAIRELEEAGCQILHWGSAGDAYVIHYKDKPKVGRPPKTETR